jgi:hypothetical protein
MNRPWRFLTGVLIASGAIVSGFTAVRPTPVLAQSGDNPWKPLADCLNTETPRLAVLFVIDTSQSLRKTDPTAQRVVAMNAALATLDAVVSSHPSKPEVFVEFVEFGTMPQRAFPNLERWMQLRPDGSDELKFSTNSLASKNGSEDTDYAGALEPFSNRRDPARAASQVGTLEMLEGAPDDTCRLVAWFTDGRLDIDFQQRPKTFYWDDAPLLIDSEADEPAAGMRAAAVICDVGGLADELRGAQRDVSSGDPFVLGIGFDNTGTVDFSLFERMVTGRNAAGETCGDPKKVTAGVFAPARDTDEIITETARFV